MSEIDARREQPAAAVFCMLDNIAAENGNVACWIERGDIHGDFKPVEGCLIFGVEKTWIAHRDDRCLAASFERGAGKLEFRALAKPEALLNRFRPRQQHRMAQMHAARRVRQDS